MANCIPTVQPAVWNPAEARMSFFRKPITNKYPCGEPVTLFQVYQYVRGLQAVPQTRDLRLVEGDEAQRAFKGHHFDYVTPSGVFTYCADTSLVSHSRLLCMDLDYLRGRVEELFQKLLEDQYFETLLLFRSPRGQGLKWFIHIDLDRCDHRTWFLAVRNYLLATYKLGDKQVDKQCGNPSRACYLGHDPEAYLRPDLIEYF